MKRIVLIFAMVFSLQSAIAQEFEMVRHQVQLGETVRMISRKYKVEPAEIYRLNKFAVDGVSQGMVLQLLVPKKDPPIESLDEGLAENSVAVNESQNIDDGTTTTTTKTVTTTIRKKKTTESQTNFEEIPAGEVANDGSFGGAGAAVTHTVLKGETLFSIARKYNTTADQIKAQNENVLKKGLQIGQVLVVMSSGTVQPDSPVSETQPINENEKTEVKHTVAKGETLYSLSKKYNIAVEDIKTQNEQALIKGLQVGQILTIKTAN